MFDPKKIVASEGFDGSSFEAQKYKCAPTHPLIIIHIRRRLAVLVGLKCLTEKKIGASEGFDGSSFEAQKCKCASTQAPQPAACPESSPKPAIGSRKMYTKCQKVQNLDRQGRERSEQIPSFYQKFTDTKSTLKIGQIWDILPREGFPSPN